MNTGFTITRFISSIQAPHRWCPAIDIYRYGADWLVKCELAGIIEKDIQLAAKGNYLCISGRRRDLLIRDGHTSHSMEIVYDHFERLIEMPMNIESATIRTVYQDGMLLIYLQRGIPDEHA